MQLFSAVATKFSKRKFFDHKKLKKPPSKVAHNRPKPFISQSSPAHSPELIFHITKFWEQAFVLLSVPQILKLIFSNYAS
jgi:hypothetical protein